jgi:hypothetical protein
VIADFLRDAEFPIDTGVLAGPWHTLTELAGPRFPVIENWLAAQERDYLGLDRRGQGAFVMGGIAYNLSAVLAAYELTGEPLPGVTFGVAITHGTARYRFAAGMPRGASAGAQLESLMTPLVLRVATATRLGRAAQWRYIADCFASAFLTIGRHLGREPEARERALSLLRTKDLAIANPQTGYREVTVGEVTQCFLKRGGCCRYYTADTGDYCKTCILRPDEEQVALLEAYLIESTTA